MVVSTRPSCLAGVSWGLGSPQKDDMFFFVCGAFLRVRERGTFGDLGVYTYYDMKVNVA